LIDVLLELVNRRFSAPHSKAFEYLLFLCDSVNGQYYAVHCGYLVALIVESKLFYLFGFVFSGLSFQDLFLRRFKIIAIFTDIDRPLLNN